MHGWRRRELERRSFLNAFPWRAGQWYSEVAASTATSAVDGQDVRLTSLLTGLGRRVQLPKTGA
jgi:hypothetical protein